MGFAASVREFCEAASAWLGPLDAPAIESLYVMADELDSEGPSPAMLAQFGLAYRSLLKRAPSDAPVEDEFERLLAEGISGGDG